MFFNSIKETNRLRIEINKSLSKEKSNIYLRILKGKSTTK